MLTRLSELEKALEGATNDPDAMDKILQDLGDAQAEAERRGVYGALAWWFMPGVGGRGRGLVYIDD